MIKENIDKAKEHEGIERMIRKRNKKKKDEEWRMEKLTFEKNRTQT